MFMYMLDIYRYVLCLNYFEINVKGFVDIVSQSAENMRGAAENLAAVEQTEN